MLFFAFGGLMASLAAGYGVLFTIVDDYRDKYGISESSIGMVIGIGFLAGFLSQVLIAPSPTVATRARSCCSACRQRGRPAVDGGSARRCCRS